MTTPTRDLRVALRERRAQAVLAVRAFEESDPDCLLLSAADRAKATRRALAVTGMAEADPAGAAIEPRRRIEALTRRARLLFDRLEQRRPWLRRMIAVSSVAGLTLPAISIGALGAGALADALGPWRRINLLAFPLFALWVWNLAVYVLIVARLVARARVADAARSARTHASRLGGTLAGVLVRAAVGRYRTPKRDDDDAGLSERERIEARAITRYGALWRRAASDLLARRASVALHLGSACLVAGMLAGMYVRALVLEYRVGWESTLLEPSQVQAVLDVALGPAATALGIEVPDVSPLRVVGGDPAAGGSAATWLHLFALTSIGLVLLPRAALAAYSAACAVRLSHRLPIAIDDPYYRRTFAAVRGASRAIRIRPYGFRPPATTTHTLSCLLAEHFGARAVIDQREPLAYGQPLPDPVADADDGRDVCRVLLFNAAQTPELDVHGAILREARERAESTGDQLLVAVDASSYAGRPAARLAERLAAWRGVVQDAGFEAIVVDSARPIDDAALVEVAAAIYRARRPRGRE